MALQHHLFFLLGETFREPKEAMRRIMAMDLPANVPWMILIIIVCLSVLMSKLAMAMVPAEEVVGPSPFPDSPLLLAIVMWLGIVIVVLCTHYIGRAFGGTGTFEDSLRAGIWFQTVMVALQVAQLVVFIISPVFAVLLGYAVLCFGIWIMVNFIAAIHGFTSNGHVLLGLIVSVFGVAFGLSLLITLFSVLFGLDFRNV